MVYSLKFIELRKYHNLTQKKFGEICNVSRHVITQIELGRNNPSLETVYALSIYFNISIDYFFTEELTIELANKTQKQVSQAKESVSEPRSEEKDIMEKSIELSESNRFNRIAERRQAEKTNSELIESMKNQLVLKDEIIASKNEIIELLKGQSIYNLK